MMIKIFGAYPWSVKDETYNDEEKTTKNEFSPKAINTIIERVKGRIETERGKELSIPEVKIFYSRLRATSGSFVINSIRNRMQSAYAIIFDITDFNPNVMLELGIALELQQRTDCTAKVFLICRAEKYCHKLLPSDLSGYFLSTYDINDKTHEVTFGDGGSLVMRITSDVFESLGISYIEQIQGI